MAKRILSANSALMPQAQSPLPRASVRTESRGALPRGLAERWVKPVPGAPEALLFDWNDRRALMEEIHFVNSVQGALDEAAVKLAPSLLRIVLTVKQHVATPEEQNAFLAEHLELDFRRISEMCIVAESYGLLTRERRTAGEREISKYGWSNALKLAYVRDAADRKDIWERACHGRPAASYRSVLEEIRRFRERKQIGAPAPGNELAEQLGAVHETFAEFSKSAKGLASVDDYLHALEELERVRKELNRLRRVLKEQAHAAEVEDLAATA